MVLCGYARVEASAGLLRRLPTLAIPVKLRKSSFYMAWNKWASKVTAGQSTIPLGGQPKEPLTEGFFPWANLFLP